MSKPSDSQTSEKLPEKVAGADEHLIQSKEVSAAITGATTILDTADSVAKSFAFALGTLSPILLAGLGAAKLIGKIKEHKIKAQTAPTRIRKIGSYAAMIGLGIVGVVAAAVAPVALLPSLIAGSAITTTNRVISFVRAWRGGNNIETLINQKQEKLAVATHPDRRLFLQSQIYPLQKKLLEEKKQQQDELNKKTGLSNKETLLLQSLQVDIKKLEASQEAILKENPKLKDLGVIHANQLMEAQKTKRNWRAFQTVMQGCTLAGLVMMAIPFPPIQLAGAALLIGSSLVGLVTAVVRHRHQIAAGLKSFAKRFVSEAKQGFPSVRSFFAKMVNSISEAITGAKVLDETNHYKPEAIPTPVKTESKQSATSVIKSSAMEEERLLSTEGDKKLAMPQHQETQAAAAGETEVNVAGQTYRHIELPPPPPPPPINQQTPSATPSSSPSEQIDEEEEERGP